MAFDYRQSIDPVSVPIRPLSGMIRDVSPSLLKIGTFWTVSNYYVEKKGLTKRKGYSFYCGGNAVDSDDQPIVGIGPVWKTDGTQFACLLTSRYLYTLLGYAAPSAVHWKYDDGFITAVSTVVTGYGTDWDATANYVLAGDYIVLDADGSGDGPEEILISTVSDHNTIVLASAPTGTYTGTEYIEYGDGEDVNSPTLDGGTTGLSDATWARSSTQVKGDTYSWVLTKTAAAGVNPGLVYLTDTVLTNDLHGLSAGATYYVSFWMYSDVGTVTNATVKIQEYYGGAWHDSLSFDPDVASTWELKESAITLNAGTTAVTIEVQIAAAEDAGKVLYVDDLSILGGGIDYEIRRRFNVNSKYLLDWTTVDNVLLIADHTRPLYSYTGAVLSIYDSDLIYIPGCVTFFKDRLWIGNIIESGVYYRYRIRWSSPTDHTSFDAADYLDLPYTVGMLKRLVPMGQVLVAYFADAIYIGRKSNLVDLPYAFYGIETGGIGLIGARAVTTALNGHFFVGADDVYYLSINGLKKLECPVADPMITECANPDWIYVVADPNNERIILGFPEGTGYISKVWMYSYRTKQWSYEDVTATCLSNPLLDLGLTWDDLSGVISQDDWDVGMADFSTWDSIGEDAIASRRIYKTENGYVYQLSDDGGDDAGVNVTGTFETGDMDFDLPDDDKSYYQFRLKLAERPPVNLTFTVTYSLDGGYTWSAGANIIITTEIREEKIDFIATGSHIRFRVTESGGVRYTVIALGIRLTKRGTEVEFD